MKKTLILIAFIIVSESSVFSQSHAAKTSRPIASEGYVAGADRVRLFYRKVGTGKDLIVLLHGGPGSNMNAVWLDLEPLVRKRTVLMYDQRGGGRSEIIYDTNKLKYTDHVRDLEAFRKHFGLKRMMLVGESWGAGLATLYAMEHPHRVSRLLLLGPMPPSRALMTRRLGKTDERLDFSKRLSDFRRELPAASDPVALCREFFAAYRAALFFDPAAFSRRRGSSCDAPPEGVRNYMLVNDATFGSLGEYDFIPKLRQLWMPALIVEGAQSIPTLDSAHAWAEAMPNARLLLIPGSGHFPQVEQPRLFFSAVEHFLNGRWPTGAVIKRKTGNQLHRS
jgi:proline iminopeptidase